ncbi:MAG: hypothetical protein KIT12_14320, partial [Trueperaceae bacterium]|nr:hypothetical protein [Trueperaceae bacterium]
MPTDVRPPTGSLFPDLTSAPWWAPLELLSRQGAATGGHAAELALDLAVARAGAGPPPPPPPGATRLRSGRA